MDNNQLYKQALSHAQLICSKKEMYIKGLKEKLKRFELNDSDLEELIEALKTEKFIDENRYAIAFARDKHRFNKWGRRKIEFELRIKQIPQDIISKSTQHIDTDLYTQNLIELLEKKHRSIRDTDTYKVKHKLISFATNKGYLIDEIEPVIHHLLAKDS
ncbi:recombination regulator RecX [Bacteroidales bacterium]|nr:recombination regulator RecX [Bacteroidales bacterium]